MPGDWSSTLPAAPGRYWWRAPDKYQRDDRRQYGLVLVQWVTYGQDIPPSLRIVTLCAFNSMYGGELDGRQGWSYSGGYTAAETDKHYPGIEFWSESERGPESFLPELPGKPEWTPRDPKVVEAERKKSAAESAKRDKDESDERAEKIAEAKASGSALYECETCEGLWDGDEVVQIRECPHCNDERFNGTDEGQNCPTCNRKFTRNITEKGCPDCLDECEVLAETAPAPEPAPDPAPPKKPGKRKRST